ncbi:hypothetical protein S7S_07160 [Isoalcanivorax pacificus W11-5]|uniref:Uncharacterized protein n=1 Tax=Isoalcanivorax pacificus W11-5 TaxID=391936 RepID=A0A0B4XMU9_9GAMM|nr:hypothetical protein S7S_07160 [Isoalcanivorax pacificus W11-5]
MHRDRRAKLVRQGACGRGRGVVVALETQVAGTCAGHGFGQGQPDMTEVAAPGHAAPVADQLRRFMPAKTDPMPRQVA